MSQHDNDHDHDHPHAEISHSERPGYYDMMETAVRELLIEKRLFGADEIRRQIEVLDSRTPALGAKVVARAWVDPEFRARLLANGRAACEELGITFYDDTQLIVLENTDTVHNLIVCTLCSCYPRPVLGLPPIGTSSRPTVRARYPNPAPFWPNSARTYPMTSKSGSATRPRSFAISSCRSVRTTPTITARSNSPHWSRATP